MSLLQYGLKSIEQSECKWRITTNSNINDIYTTVEMQSTVDSKADLSHEHVDYFPLVDLITVHDLTPVTEALVNDVAFSSTYGPCLVDRTSLELYKLSVDSGSVVITATGEFAGISPNSIDITPDNMIAGYSEVINGEIV